MQELVLQGFFYSSLQKIYMTNSPVQDISPEDQKDITELKSKIDRFQKGKIDEEKFKLYRLTRGVYGQRQLGVQMFRIKIPYGRISPHQIRVIADLSKQYASNNLHLTTRQDIQLHYVKLTDSPAVWEGLTSHGLTGREACGNTVRNLTTSPTAGIDPDEPFDVTPYAHAVAYYFLRNPICQEMGRKIKPAFSSSDHDRAFTYFSDFGFIPRIKKEGHKTIRGFKVVLGGGLGAQAIEAQTAYQFLEADKIIPFMEAGLRVFDRYGERKKRQKARMKFLIKSIGVDGFLNLVEKEKKALENETIKIDPQDYTYGTIPNYFEAEIKEPIHNAKYDLWKKTNTFLQKDNTYYGVYLRIQLGDISSEKARTLADIIEPYASDDIRITINQGLLLRHVHENHLAELFSKLDTAGFAEPGFDSIADVTACPGTDTCNLAVTNSTGLTRAIENMIRDEYEHLLEEDHIKIKISGCMNACGQHMAANIGFHGSSIKKNGLIIPAMQIVLAGGIDRTGKGWIAEKIIKVPTKKILEVIRVLLEDFEKEGDDDEYFNYYYARQGKKYFYSLLKHLSNIEELEGTEFFDWEQDHQYQQSIGVGECAGVMLDVVGTILQEAEDRIQLAHQGSKEELFVDANYHAYSAIIIAAKGLLLSEDISCNTQIGIINDFEKHFIESQKFAYEESFTESVLSLNKNEPKKSFSQAYISQATDFVQQAILYRNRQLENTLEKKVISNHYKA